jgi:Bardet-Biedl syndrome 4 protein
MRQQGRIEESLTIFQAALCLNPMNINNIKQVGQSLYLLGKHKEALGVFEEAERINSEDRMIWHCKGVCYRFLKDIDQAIQCFETANSIQKHERTFSELGELFRQAGRAEEALSAYLDALDAFPESTHFLTMAGLLHLQANNSVEAFQHLGNALTYDPKEPVAILAAGSIIQNNSDHDVALSKYRVAMSSCPHSAELWNNIGMCFFGKAKMIHAVSCLKRAVYLSPFDGRIHYNLGIVHLALEQHASAFHYLSAAINLQRVPNVSPTLDDARCYTFLAVALSRLQDYENAFAAYDKSIELCGTDAATRLNYAISLMRSACSSSGSGSGSSGTGTDSAETHTAAKAGATAASTAPTLGISAARERAIEQVGAYDRLVARQGAGELGGGQFDEEEGIALTQMRRILAEVL